MDNQSHGNDGTKMKPIARPSLGKAAPKAQIPALGGFSGIGKGSGKGTALGRHGRG